MSDFLKFAVLLCFTIQVLYGYKEFPKYLPNCHRYDPNLNNCLLKATEQMKPYLAKGIPELNILPFEPFHIPEITLEQGTKALNFKALLTNVLIYGLTDYKFSRFDFDVPNLQFFCECSLNQLRLEGDYTVKGKILIAPIEGAGKFKASIDSCNATVYHKVKIQPKKGVDFILPIITNSSIQVGGPKATLDGLFDGNAELGNVTNKVINDNVKELFEELRPVIEKILDTLLADITERAFEGQIPFDKLYPKIK